MYHRIIQHNITIVITHTLEFNTNETKDNRVLIKFKRKSLFSIQNRNTICNGLF